MKQPRAWSRRCFASRFIRPLLRHQFWREAMGKLGPRYILATVGPGMMYLDLLEHLGVSRHILKHGSHEPTVSRLLPEWIGPSGNVIDIGANIGYFTVLAAHYTTGTVYAFEPEAHCFQQLLQNLGVNGLQNVKPSNKAAGEARGAHRLHISERNTGDHRLYEFRDAKESVEVEMVSIDQELADLDNVTFVKIDVQGFEERVVRGMRGLLIRNHGVTVLGEFEPSSIQASGASGDEFLDFMESLGFKWLAIDETEQNLVVMDKPSLYVRCGTDGHVNLCFSRS